MECQNGYTDDMETKKQKMDQKNVFINDSATAAVWALSDISLYKSDREMLVKEKRRKERKRESRLVEKW